MRQAAGGGRQAAGGGRRPFQDCTERPAAAVVGSNGLNNRFAFAGFYYNVVLLGVFPVVPALVLQNHRFHHSHLPCFLLGPGKSSD